MYKAYVNKIMRNNNVILVSIYGYLKVIVVHGDIYCSHFKDRLGLYCVTNADKNSYSVYVDYLHLRLMLNSHASLVEDVIELLRLEEEPLPPAD